jgi:hypothetical protein
LEKTIDPNRPLDITEFLPHVHGFAEGGREPDYLAESKIGRELELSATSRLEVDSDAGTEGGERSMPDW